MTDTPMTMVERMFGALQHAWDESDSLPPIDFSSNETAHLARAILTELREPTPGMVEAAFDCPEYAVLPTGDALMTCMFRAMITAALEETRP